MNLNQLIYFATLAQLQHVTRASEKLNIAQPSLSKAIANLEQELGVDLFEKQGRNVVLTRQGKLYLDYVEKALESLEEGRSALQRMQTELDQRIDIGFVSSLQARMMPQLLADYRKTTGSKERRSRCWNSWRKAHWIWRWALSRRIPCGLDRIRCSVRSWSY